jgi:hypothetical protein
LLLAAVILVKPWPYMASGWLSRHMGCLQQQNMEQEFKHQYRDLMDFKGIE